MKLFLLVFISFLLSVISAQSTRIISPDGQDTGNCIAPSPPCATIQYAYLDSLSNGQEGDTIELLPGVYGPGSDSIFVSVRTFILTAANPGDVTIELNGAFSWIVPIGGTGAVNSIRNIIFSGANNVDTAFFDGNDQDWDFENIIWRDANSPEVRRFIILDGGITNFRNCTWENIIIPLLSNGQSSIIFIDDDDQVTTFDDCIFRNNRALDAPVHIRASNSNPAGWITTFNRCQIFQNIGDRTSGFLRVQDSNNPPNDPIVTFNDCIIDSNSGSDAGAIWQAVGDLFLNNCTITNCVSFNAGGALDLNDEIQRFETQGGIFANNDIVGLGSAACMVLDGRRNDMPPSVFLINQTSFVSHFIEPISAGGGVFSSEAGTIWHREADTFTIMDCTFQLNSVGTTGRAGALLLEDDTIITDSSFTNTNGFGAIVIDGGNSVIQRTPFSSFPVDLVIEGGSLTIDDDTNLQSFEKQTLSILQGTLTLGSGLTSSTIDNIQMDGGTLELQTDLTITTSFTWTDGTIDGPGSLILGPNCITEIVGSQNSQRVANAPVINNGLVSFSGSGQCLQTSNFTNANTVLGSVCSISIENAGSFTNLDNSVLRARGLTFNVDDGDVVFSASTTIYVQLTSATDFNGLTFTSPNNSPTVTLNGVLGVEAALPFGPSVGQTFGSIINREQAIPFAGMFSPPSGGIAATLVSVNGGAAFNLTIDVVSLTLVDDNVRTLEDQSVTFNPFENDIIPGGILIDQDISGEGDATVTRTGFLVTFVPPENENGLFTFDYSLGGTSATVTVEVLAVNDGPQVSPVENVNVGSDPGSFTFPGEDIDTPDSEIQVFLLTLPANGGTIMVDGQPLTVAPTQVPRTVQYSPMDGMDDSVEYLLSDGIILTDTVALSINFDDSQDNTAVTVGIVLGTVIGFCCCVVIILAILLIVWRAKKPPKTALVQLLLQPDLSVVRALQETQPADKQKQLALYFTELFCYHKLTQQLVAYYISKEVARVKSESLLFRENTFASKLLKTYADVIGRHFLRRALSDLIKDVFDEDQTFEVNPVHEQDPEKIEKNQKKIKTFCSDVLEGIFENRQHLPIECKQVCAELFKQSENKWTGTGAKAVGAFLFLRWISPALISPEGWGISSSAPKQHDMRNLLLIVKPLQNLANGLKFGSKEEYMNFMNEWIDEKQQSFDEFIEYARDDSRGESSPDITKSNYKSSVNEIHKIIFDTLTDVTDKLEKVDADRLNKIMVLLGAPDDSDVNVELQMLAENQVRESTMMMSSAANSMVIETHSDNE